MVDNALGTYLRERREATTPEQVGLPRGERRRTPGLRRAELATLSGVSVDYLTRLEQGRDQHPSAAVLVALADTMQLSADERALLMRLGVVAGSGELCPANAEPARSVRPSLATLLDAMEPTAALVVNRVGDVLASTSGWTTVFEAIGLTDDDHPNVIRHLFTDPRARTAFVPWERAADHAAATLLSDNRPDDAHLVALLAQVAEHDDGELARRMAASPSVPAPEGVIRLAHPMVGELRLAVETFEVPHAEQRLIAYLPHDAATVDAIDELRRGGGRLHAVPG
jgi:transcriptional regulator with XRE-family HTH domain